MKYIILLLINTLTCVTVFADPTPKIKKKIVIGTYVSPPFVIKNKDNTYGGLSFDLWNKIAQKNEYDFEIKEYTLENINVMLKDINSGKLDAALGSITITSKRLDMVDFSQPYFITTYGVATTIVDESTSMQIVRKFFSWDYMKVIIFIFVLLFCMGIVMWIVEHNHNPDFNHGPAGIFDGFYFMAVVQATVGFGDKAAKTNLGKSIIIIFMFACFFINTIFTSSITAAFTVEKLENEIENINVLKKRKVGTIQGTTSSLYLNDHSIRHIGFNNVVEGLYSIKNKELDALVYDTPVLKYMIKKEGLENYVQLSSKEFDTQFYGVAINKNLVGFRESINPLILQYTTDPEWQQTLFKYNLVY